MRTDIVRGSIWIRITGPALDAVNGAIRRIRHRLGGPGAWPHVSLAGGIACPRLDMERAMDVLAGRIAPFTVRLGRVECRDQYWGALRVTVEPSDALRAAHRAVMRAFGLKDGVGFEPCVGLLYGDYDAAARRALAQELGDGLAVPFEAASVEFVNATVDIPILEWRTLRVRDLAGEPARSGHASGSRGQSATPAER